MNSQTRSLGALSEAKQEDEKVKNEQKFKTAEERVKAFGEFCKNEFCNQCNHLDCKLHKQGSAILHCYDGWLSLEADEEKPEPCPFCGNPCSVCASTHYEHRIVCNNLECGYHSQAFPKESDADLIAAHNRVARAVRAAKEGGMK